MRILFVLFFLALPAYAESFCANAVGGDVTVAFIAYLDTLSDARELSPDAIFNFRNELAAGTLVNPLANAPTLVAKIHRQELEHYLHAGPLRTEEILAWANEAVARFALLEKSRENSARETQRTFTQIKFLPIEAGEVAGLTLTHPIEVMQTLVTQQMWLELFQSEPTAFGLRPEEPVTWMTWARAARFANRLSEQAGLPPAYDLSALDKWLEGNKLGLPNWDRAPRISVNAPDENIYLTKGYRLPTLTEMKFLASGGVNPKEEIFPGLNDSNASEYAWWKANSRGKVKDVCTRHPFMVQGQAFFDLLGNVQVWTHDQDGIQLRTAQVNPFGRHTEGNPMLCVFGAGFNSQFEVLGYRKYAIRKLHFGNEGLGFRLVRTLE